jgi:hypothetical protein
MTLFNKILLLMPVCAALIYSDAAGQDTINDLLLSRKSHKAETSDTLARRHNPTMASIYSAVLPGLGQVYNKKYWKVPVIYAGFGVFYYFIQFNDKEYKAWRAAYNHALVNADSLEPPVNDYERLYGYNTEILKDQKNYYRRNRDLSYILTSIWYLLNIVDATVDAQMFTWEIDDDLSMRFEPAMYEPIFGSKAVGGLRLTLKF